jgi:DUF438 domain-containing protein
MWGKHDEIRSLLKKATDTAGDVEALLTEMEEMITKEEKILIPMALEVLSDEDWAKVKEGEDDLGYVWVTPVPGWTPRGDGTDIRTEATDVGEMRLEVGHMPPDLVSLLLCHLPVDISFVNEHDEVVYYNQTTERIFPRTPAVIGRRVQNCHPQRSVHVVEEILSAFRTGRRDTAQFWIQTGGRFVHIRYIAVRDNTGKYRGCLECTQDISPIRELKGERRLLEWE